MRLYKFTFGLTLVHTLCFFLSCQEARDNTSNTWKVEEIATKDIALLTPDSTIEFIIDERTSLYNSNIQFFQNYDDKEYLFVNNTIGNRLLFLDFKSGETAFEVTFKKGGENGIGLLRGATVLSLDSIIILGTGYESIYLADTSAQIKRVFKLTPKNKNLPQLHYGITNYFIPTNKDIYVFSMPYGLGRANEKEALKRNAILRYDLKQETWDYINISYPKVYQQEGHYTFTHFIGDIAINGNKLIINFPASNYIFVYEDGKTKKYLAKSSKVSIIYPPSDKLATTSEEIDTQILESPAYFFLDYDPYRKVYYRFLLNSQDDLSSIGDILRMYDEKPCTIVILDEDFNKIGETDLAVNTYHIPDHFIGPKGLYISTNHPDNPNVDEDKLAFQLLKLNYYEK